MWAHPRSRGENAHQAFRRQSDDGLIPAHAGKTNSSPRLSQSRPAHPRSRGENTTHGGWRRSGTGSSPLTRGKPRRPRRLPDPRGLIPAHAGKTRPRRGARWRARAHPRSRGENAIAAGQASAAYGSSPLTRGKPGREHHQPVPSGLIPAHAGKTRNTRILGNKLGAHPRSRGENKRFHDVGPYCLGSSPLTRGKPRRRCPLGNADGLIPAHAGKTVFIPAVASFAWAHPRSRGENDHSKPPIFGSRGSSPLTRGKPLTLDLLDKRCGLIPAHAGKTAQQNITLIHIGAHPRSRGENRAAIICEPSGLGSSPLTRGKPWRAFRRRSDRGLIPAHAGKTRMAQ